MFDIVSPHMLILLLVAIVLIGPKDLPRAMRVVGQWVGRGRAMARHFRSAMDDMMRESELQEMEAKWKAENERIMREHADLIAGVNAPYAGHQDTPSLSAPPPAVEAGEGPVPPSPAPTLPADAAPTPSVPQH